MVVSPFFGGRDFEAEFSDFACDWNVVKIADLDGIGGDDRDVVVVQIDDAPGVGDDRAGIGRDDGFTNADTDDDRTATTGGDDLVGLPGGENGDAEGAVDLMKRVANGLEKIAPVTITDE